MFQDLFRTVSSTFSCRLKSFSSSHCSLQRGREDVGQLGPVECKEGAKLPSLQDAMIGEFRVSAASTEKCSVEVNLPKRPDLLDSGHIVNRLAMSYQEETHQMTPSSSDSRRPRSIEQYAGRGCGKDKLFQFAEKK